MEVSDNPKRKTKYDLVSVYKESLGWVNIDSQAPNMVVGEWLAKQDAPSERARRHVRELEKAVMEGYRGIIAFVIPMEGITRVLPNRETDADFGEVLDEARRLGVEIWNFPCTVTENTLKICGRLVDTVAKK